MNMADVRRIVPKDSVAPRQDSIHSDLEAWGRWSRDRVSRVKCGSAEGNYRPRNGNIDMGWEHNAPEPSPVVLPNTRMVAIDKAVLKVPDLHRWALKLHYVNRKPAQYICEVLAIRKANFAQFMERGRDMVENILARYAK